MVRSALPRFPLTLFSLQFSGFSDMAKEDELCMWVFLGIILVIGMIQCMLGKKALMRAADKKTSKNHWASVKVPVTPLEP